MFEYLLRKTFVNFIIRYIDEKEMNRGLFKLKVYVVFNWWGWEFRV